MISLFVHASGSDFHSREESAVRRSYIEWKDARSFFNKQVLNQPDWSQGYINRSFIFFHFSLANLMPFPKELVSCQVNFMERVSELNFMGNPFPSLVPRISLVVWEESQPCLTGFRISLWGCIRYYAELVWVVDLSIFLHARSLFSSCFLLLLSIPTSP